MKTFILYLLLLTLSAFNIGIATAQSANSHWAFNMDSNDPTWAGGSVEYIEDAVKVADGFVMVGSCNEQVFLSRDGNSIGRTDYGGAYVIKYDFNGNIQWLNYAIDSNFSYFPLNARITSVAVDANENIYIAGRLNTQDHFYYDGGAGDTCLALPHPNAPYWWWDKYFITKLDKNGHLLWSRQSTFWISDLAYDNKGRIIAYAFMGGGSGMYLDGASYVDVHVSTPEIGYFDHKSLLWIDTANGELLNYANIADASNNYAGSGQLATDTNGNVFLTGLFENRIRFYGANYSDSISIEDFSLPTTNSKFYLVKYSPAGIPLWKVSDNIIGTSEGTGPADIQVSKSGTIYIPVGYHYQVPNGVTNFYNSDSSVTTLPQKQYSLYAINQNGYLKWAARGGFTHGYSVLARDTDILVRGTNYAASTDSFCSAGTPSISLYMQHQSPSIAIAQYDTLGNILAATKAGEAETEFNFEVMQMIEADSQSIITYGWGWHYNSPDTVTWKMYGNSMLFNGHDGYVIKSKLGLSDTLYTPPPQIIIKTDFDNAKICIGDTAKIPVATTSNFNQGNIFSVLISDANGVFNSSPNILGAVASTGGTDTFSVLIPAGMPPGNNYKIKIVSSDPVITSNTASGIILSEPLYPALTLSVSPTGSNPPGTLVSFSTSVTNSGANPIYHWYRNGQLLASTADTSYADSTFLNGDTVTVVIQTNDACANTDTAFYIVRVKTAGIAGAGKQAMDVQLFPNPNAGSFMLQGMVSETKVSMEIISLTGQVVQRMELPVNSNLLQTQVDIDKALANGIYVCKLMADKQTVQLLFVLNR